MSSERYERSSPIGRLGQVAWVVALALPWLATPSSATPLPGKAAIDDLEHTRDWVVEVDGEEVLGSRVYYSEYEVAWLLQVPGHGSLLLSPRGENSVQRIDGKGFTKKAGVGASMKALDAARVVAHYEMSRQVMTFEIEEHAFTLRPAPPVLGRRSSEDLGERHPAFVPKAADYRQKAELQGAPPLKAADEDLVVRVYFGSWSPICERIVPKIMAVEASWKSVRFEYYGLPKSMTDDAHAVEMQLTGVPTVVVMRGGEEVERLSGRQLDEPEVAIRSALRGL